MGRAKDLDAIRRSPNNVRFTTLCAVVEAIGYELRRVSGSHRVYRHATRRELPMINLQPKQGKAKPYQVREVLDIIDTYSLEVE